MSKNSGSTARVEMDPSDQSMRTIALKICDGSQAVRPPQRLKRYNHTRCASHSQTLGVLPMNVWQVRHTLEPDLDNASVGKRQTSILLP